MSAAAASSTCAAIWLPASITLSLASTIAAPLVIIDLEPPVPPPAINWSLSPCNRRIRRNGMPSFASSTWAKGEAWPWP